MKRAIGIAAIAGLLLPMTLVISSCESYNFSEPQPVDKKNVYEFPKGFRGKWIEKDSETQMDVEVNIPLDQNTIDQQKEVSFSTNDSANTQYEFVSDDNQRNERLWIEIGKGALMLIQHETINIATGCWPVRNDSGKLQLPSWTSTVESLINYDSLQHPVDTSLQYIRRGAMIYEVKEKTISKGYAYTLQADTIKMYKYDTVYIQLGDYAFLRKLKDNLYALNINNLLLEERVGWWHLNILELTDQKTLKVWDCSYDLSNDPGMIYRMPNMKDFFFNSRWTTQELLEHFSKGHFDESEFEKKK